MNKKKIAKVTDKKNVKKAKCSNGAKAFLEMHEIIKNNNIEMINTFKQIKYYL